MGMLSDGVSVLPVWEYSMFGNRLLDYVIALGIFAAFVVAFKWIQWAVLRSLEQVAKRTRTELDDAMIAVVRLVRPQFYTYVALYLAVNYLNI